MTTAMTLAVTNLSLHLGDSHVLDGVTHPFAAGRVTAILGPNGAGKSSLLRCLDGLEQPTGTVALNGTPMAAMPPRQRARTIGYLAQQAAPHWDIDVATLVALGRHPWRNGNDSIAIHAAMAACDIETLAHRPLSTLSGGERARVLFARVLAGQPRWILADEPLAALDPAHQLRVAGLLRQAARQGAGVVVVLHDLTLAARLADDVLMLRDGRIVAAGPASATLTSPNLSQLFDILFAVDHGDDGGLTIHPLDGLSHP